MRRYLLKSYLCEFSFENGNWKEIEIYARNRQELDYMMKIAVETYPDVSILVEKTLTIPAFTINRFKIRYPELGELVSDEIKTLLHLIPRWRDSKQNKPH